MGLLKSTTSTMRLTPAIFLVCLIVLCISCQSDGKKIGLHDDFTTVEGWREINPRGDTILPALKMESKDGVLIIHHKFRTLEEAAEKWPWIESTEDTSTNLRKDYGVVDLDWYHYVVLDVREKGSSSFFDINGFTTKLGYTTGLTVIDLKDYDDDRIRGKRRVNFGIDLQDNHTHLTLDDLKFASELSKEEQEKLIGSGLTIREEHLGPRPYHGLEALKKRENILVPVIDGEEMAIFRDDATGGITTRLTATPGDDYFGEGGIWSADGAAIKFESSRKIGGIPICIPGEGRVIAGPKDAGWRMWSENDPDVLYLMKRNGLRFSVFSWNRITGEETPIAAFSVPEVGSYIEFKRFTPLGNIVVAFRETPHLYIIDVKNKKARYINLPTRLKDASVGGNDNIIRWANCYTYEVWWMNLDIGEKGLVPGFSAGHASHGPNGMVANFGGHLNVFVPGDIGDTFTPGDKISVWANWKNDIVTDYGRLTADNQYVFTNGTRVDVDHQHLMISSKDPGAVMRVARYFTKFSWTSTTYSRPSPDYTKLIYNENAIGSTELQMVYTRRPDAPVNVTLDGALITWDQPKRHREIAGYNIYGSDSSGRDFVRLNEKPLTEIRAKIDGRWKYYAIASVEHSGLESDFSCEVSTEGARSFYFEAEDMALTPPARRFFDGYANGFQCVRINAESTAETASKGVVNIPLDGMPAGHYFIWGSVKGTGSWSVGANAFPVQSQDWKWMSLGVFNPDGQQKTIELSSGDDDLKLDMLLFTTDEFTPEAPYPGDGIAPGEVKGLHATVNGDRITLSWTPSPAPDLHHYSIYCGKTANDECGNETLIRSVMKTSVNDVPPERQSDLFYKVVAVDNRWNESVPAVIHVKGHGK